MIETNSLDFDVPFDVPRFSRSCLQRTIIICGARAERRPPVVRARRRRVRRPAIVLARLLATVAIVAWIVQGLASFVAPRVVALHRAPVAVAPPLPETFPMAPPLVSRFDQLGTVDEVTPLFHTLVSDFHPQPDGTMYVQTGDIPAMWLRDSSAQALPYVRFVETTPVVAAWVRPVIERDARNVLVDPYANAFSVHYRVWERKWEVDSLAFPVLLAAAYARAVPDDRAIFTQRLHWALERIVATYACEQRHDLCSSYRHTALPYGGRGLGFDETGMIWSAFRPSDDRVRYPFNIPQQMLAVVALDDLAMLAERGYDDLGLGLRARELAAQVRAGIERYGRYYDFRYGWIYAYEVDGKGGVALMDDANLPSLLAAPYFGYVAADDPVYRNTRAFVLSSDNPYYYRGAFADGVGSPHTPKNWVWPLALIARALTSASPEEAANELTALVRTDGDDGLVHESFDPDAYWRFTREEFGWANAMYAELVFSRATCFGPLPPFHQPTSLLPVTAAAATAHAIALPVVSITDGLRNAGVVMQALRRALPGALQS